MLKQYRLKNYHFQLVVYIIALSIIGILLIGSAKHSVQSKQIIGFVMGLTIMIVLSLIDYTFLLKFVWIYYAGMIVLLLLVLFAGDDAKGAQRWFEIAGIRFQPSEIAKIILILFFAYFFSRFEDSINTVRTLALSVIFAGIPLFLILKQPDNSTTILTALIFATLLFISGLSYKIIMPILGVSVPIVLIVISYIYTHADALIKKGFYPATRIMSWLDPTNYADTAAQQRNSIWAIGSGQLFGKGLNNSVVTSMKNTNYIIEPQTDFIFAVAGEELGFIGTISIIILLLLIVIECILIARKAKDTSGKLICCGMGALIGFQAFINLCVATGLMPNTGMTLPFVSSECRITAEEIFIGRLAMNIGLVAHDSKKKLMQNFCIAYRGILSKNNLYDTGTTGRLIEEVANLSVHKYLAGHLGGIQQLGAQIEHNDIDLVIFLRDPLKPKPHEPEVNSIFRICDEHNIPLATNLATAELLILSLDRGDLDWREMYK